VCGTALSCLGTHRGELFLVHGVLRIGVIAPLDGVGGQPRTLSALPLERAPGIPRIVERKGYTVALDFRSGERPLPSEGIRALGLQAVVRAQRLSRVGSFVTRG
jgi:hypothetical protein